MANAVALLAKPSHTVVLMVSLLAATDLQAAQVKTSGINAGKGQLPITLPSASASNTRAYTHTRNGNTELAQQAGWAKFFVLNANGKYFTGKPRVQCLRHTGSCVAAQPSPAAASTTTAKIHATATPLALVAASASCNHCHTSTAKVGGVVGPITSATSTTVKP